MIDHSMKVKSVLVQIPYGLKETELVLEPNTEGTESPTQLIRWMLDTKMPDDAIERVFRGTEVLFARNAGSFGACLHTALIWECG